MAQQPARQQQKQPQQSDQQIITFEGYTGLNTQPSRVGIEDTQLYICDGFMPIGTNNLRVIPDIGTPIYTGPAMVGYFDFANIGATPYCIIVNSTGGIYAVNTATLVLTPIAADGTILNPSQGNVALTQWGSQYVIIVANQPNGYFIWDGTTFFLPGASVAGGTVPTGIRGTAVETYQSRVWVANGPNIFFSAPDSVVDFSTGSGGGNFTSNDSYLRVAFIRLVSSNGYLFLIGDSSISYLAGVQTSGATPTTTFTVTNADPEVGTPWPGSVDVLGSNIIFANAWGVHVSYGGRTVKVSPELDGIYNTVSNFGGLIPSAAKTILYGKRLWLLLLPVIDSYTSQQINKLMIWDEKHWFTAQQNVNLIYIQHQEINSVLTAYGTDGATIYPLMKVPGAAIQKVARSKLWAALGGYATGKSAGRMWGAAQYFSNTSPTLTISIDSEDGAAPETITASIAFATWINNSSVVATWVNNASVAATWLVTGGDITVFPPQDTAQNGVLLGFTVTTNAADVALLNLSMQPIVTQGRF